MELIYLIYLFSGIFKAFFYYFNIDIIPFDFTLFTAALLTLSLFTKKRTKFSVDSYQFFLLFLLGIFYMLMLVSLAYSSSRGYSIIKTFYFLTNILAFCYPLLIKDFNLKLFLKSFISLTVVLSAIFLIIFSIEYKGDSTIQSVRFNEISGLSLSLGELTGLVFIMALIQNNYYLLSKNQTLILSLITFGLLILMGARGPILTALLLLVIYSLFRMKIRFKLNRFTVGIILIILIALPVLIILFYPILERSVDRMFMIINGFISKSGFGDSVDVRIKFIHITWDNVTKGLNRFLFGYGIGSFNIVTTGIDGRGYPHNIVFEVLFEMGLVGVLSITSFFTYFFVKRNKLTLISIYAILYLILNLFKSSSLVDSRVVFAFLAISTLKTEIFPITSDEKDLSPDVTS